MNKDSHEDEKNNSETAESSERKLFEHWYAGGYEPSHAFERKGEAYKYLHVQMAWDVWQARAGIAQSQTDWCDQCGRSHSRTLPLYCDDCHKALYAGPVISHGDAFDSELLSNNRVSNNE